MDLQIMKTTVLDYSKRKKKMTLLLAALGFTGYGVYKIYHSPSVAHKRHRLIRLFTALAAITEAVSDSADTIGVVSKDLTQFLQSDSDEIPKTLKQISKITNSDEFCSSMTKLTQSLTVGILRGVRSHSGTKGPSFTERVMEKMFTESGSGFASVVVGSFARNLVMGFYSDGESIDNVPKWVDAVCSDQCRELIGDCVQLFITNAVSVYLDKTMSVNTYDQLFSGLTNPKHSSKVNDMLVSVCNGAVHTLVETSHQVLTARPSSDCGNLINSTFNDNGDEMREWSVAPRKRRFVLDVAGRVAYETVRSFLEFLLDKVYDGMRRCADMVYEGRCQVYRYVYGKSYVGTLCLY